ncbi:hypothetical protein PANO111632_02140 [Paracoccus nototheniae]
MARALMNRPDLLLTPGSTSNPDPVPAAQVTGLIVQVNGAEGMTFLFLTHDDKIASLFRRRIVVGGGLVTGRGASTGGGVT